MWEIKLRNISIIDSFNQRGNHAKLLYLMNYTSTPQNKLSLVYVDVENQIDEWSCGY